MANPLTVTRNNYHKNKKSSTVYTPTGVAQFLFDLLYEPIKQLIKDPRYRLHCPWIFDPAIGSGRLTDPWYMADCHVTGCDVKLLNKRPNTHEFIKGRFEDCTWYDDWPHPDLVLCNSPFNGAQGKRLYPEVFLEHIFKLFGVTQPTVLFVPMGFRLNQRKKSKRWRWLRDCGAEITSIISLPLDVFEDVEFHSEIVIFNIKGLKPHYWLPEKYL